MNFPKDAKPHRLNLPLINFLVCELLTFALWDHYFNSLSSFDRDIAGTMVLIMGTLFAVASALFFHVIENRRSYLEKEVRLRTLQLVEEEKETRREKERLAVTLRSIGDGVIATDPCGSVSLFNSGAEALTGWKEPEVLGRDLSEVLKIIDSKTQETYDVKSLLDGKNIEPSEELVLITKARLYRFIAATSAPIRDEHGSVCGRVVAFRDITTDKMAEIHLRWAEERYRTIFENSAIAITVTDREERIVSWNRSAENLLQMGQEELRGKPVEAIYPPNEWKKLRLLHIRRKGMLKPIETKVIRKDGTVVEVELAVTILKSPEGEITGSIGIIRDITERKEIDRLKDGFISMTSHELRTPVTIIREAVSQILEGVYGQTNELQKGVMSLLSATVERLSRLIDDLLDLSRIEAGRVELRWKLIDFTTLSGEIVLNFRPLAEKKGIEIRTRFPEKPLETYADRDKIVQVLTNLVGNAIKFTEKGYVEISGAEQADAVRLCVADSGRGIAEEDLPKVFGKFQQFGEQNNLPQKGTGLGLAISKGIVSLHRGKIWVESRAGVGTNFIFTIPRCTGRAMLQESVKDSLKESMNTGLSFSVLRFGLSGFRGQESPEIQAKGLEKAIADAVGMRGYTIREGTSYIWGLLRLDKETALRISKAVEAALAAYAGTKDGEWGVDILPLILTFPDDVSSEEEFLDKVLL